MSDNPTHKSKRLISWLSPLVAAALAAALTVQPGTAASATASPDAQPTPDPAVSFYAADYSVSLGEAQRRLNRIQPLQEILATIRDLESTRLAGWSIDHTVSFGGWVWLTGDNPPGSAAAAIAAVHADVEIRTGADHSHAELLAVQQRLFRNGAVGRVNDGPTSGVAAMVTFTGIDMAANAVRIGIDPALALAVPGGLTDTGPTTVSDEAFQVKAAEVAAQLQNDISVSYVVEDGRGLSDHATFIGGQGMSQCTAGFTARHRGTGSHGIVTAAHCRGSISMHGVRLVPVVDRLGPDIDARFLSVPTGSSHRLLDEFVCRGVLPCDVTGDISRNRMMGSYVCHYGKNSGYSCGTVTDIDHYPVGNYTACSSRCDNTFVSASGPNLRGCRGDSGGPFYRGGVAYGIHMGGTDRSDCGSGNKHLVFSAIQRVERQLGVDILTRGPVTVP